MRNPFRTIDRWFMRHMPVNLGFGRALDFEQEGHHWNFYGFGIAIRKKEASR